MAISPFDLADHLNTKNEPNFDIHEYNPWMVNAVLSNHMQTILFANMMNQYYDLTYQQQYDFMYNAIPAGKRFGKWNKKEVTFDKDIIEAIKERYSINTRMAEQYAKLMSEEQLSTIIKTKGGIHNGRTISRSKGQSGKP
jgi:hypothetical protein